MATTGEVLLVSLEARVKKFENELNRANRTAQRSLRNIEGQFEKSNKRISASVGGFGAVYGKAFAAIGATAAVRSFLDSSTRINNALKTTGLTSEQTAAVYEKLFAAAQKNSAPVESLVGLYSKLSISQRELGVTSEDLVSFTENISLALRAGGTNAQSASGALLQLSQALGGGTVRAEEFNSVLEGAPTILRAVAAGMKGTDGSVAKLRQMVIAGEVSSREFFDAFQKGAPVLDKMASGSIRTIEQGITQLSNSLIDAARNLDERFNISETLARELENAANTVENIANLPIRLADQFETDVIRDTEAELERFFKTYRAGVAAMAPGKLVAFDRLKQQLRDGKIGAEGARAAIAAIADANPRMNIMVRSFERMADGLKEIAKQAAIAKAALYADLGDDERQAMLATNLAAPDEIAKFRKFQKDTVDDAMRTDLEQKVDTKTKEIIEAADKVGLALGEAAARILAQKAIAIEETTSGLSQSRSGTAETIKGFESFRPNAYWDVNAWRTGFGSDTKTAADGTVSRVTQDTVVSLEDATRDLTRRISEFQDGIASQIGVDRFMSMNEGQQTALTSIAYNYGSLPDRIVKAILSGDTGDVFSAIKALGSDNGGINRNRRAEEADMYLSGASPDVKARVTASEEAATDTAARKASFAEMLAQEQRQLDMLKEETGLRANLSPLIDDNGRALSTLQKAQELLSYAQDEGTAAGKELSGVQQLLYGDLSGLTPEAVKQAEAMRALALGTGEATAAANSLDVSQEALKGRLSESSALGKDVLGGFIRDLRDGKSATEALAGALDKVADKLLDMALNSLFDGAAAGSGGGPLGGLFGGLFSMFGFAKGGVAAHGRPLKRFAGGGVSRSAAIFGEAGPEAAVPLPDGRSIPVTMSMPRAPQVPVSQQARPQVVELRVVGEPGPMFNAHVETVSRDTSVKVTRAGLGEYDKTLNGSFGKRMNMAQRRQM